MQEPEAFAQSLDSYLDSLSPEEVRALVLRSIKRLDGAHRAQLGLFLGFDLAAHPIDEVAGGVDSRALTAAIGSCALLRERFGAFLQDNPRAVAALGNTVRDRILGPPEKNLHVRRLLSQVPIGVASLLAVVIILAFVPLFAQYSHQRGMLAGLSEIVLNPIHVLPRHVPARPLALVQAPLPQVHQHPQVSRPAPHKIAPSAHRSATHRPPSKQRVATRKTSPRIAMHRQPRARPRHIARAWKFDPRYNPYFHHGRWRAVAAARFAHPPVPQRTSAFAARSALIVTSYLRALIAGNTVEALGHLGLPSNAPASNLPEAPIVSPNARMHIVNIASVPDGRTRVEVDIHSSGAEYFETFYVAHDGPAVRIVDRFYVPVNRTAEERAARLLAKDGH